jgi:hypothetical protein
LRLGPPQQHADDEGKAMRLDEADGGIGRGTEHVLLRARPGKGAGEVGDQAAGRGQQQEIASATSSRLRGGTLDIGGSPSRPPPPAARGSQP